MSLDVRAPIAIETAENDWANSRLDRATDAYLRCIAPVTFRIAASEDERHASFRLRYEAIIDQGWALPEAFPMGIEREPLDDQAVHMVGWLDGQAIATSRLILPQPGCLLPVERDFAIQVEPFGRVVEIDRSCLSEKMAARQDLLFVALLSACWVELRRAGFAVTTGRMTRSMIRLYQLLGIENEVLGPAQVSWQEARFPVRFTAASTKARFYERLQRLCG